MSEVEFVVLTVLISVRVNDSAPSPGTHYRGEMGEGQRKKHELSVTLRTTEIQTGVFQMSFFSFNFKSYSPYPHLSMAFWVF